ncbi:MAG: prephenate dehydrogenase/arogenate dehydrogenase family protein [Planctomycetota bacterium]|nr:prephenate dehydrogenase/arogenate dehydrogenase family protein [Planctomycetota bacterium]
MTTTRTVVISGLGLMGSSAAAALSAAGWSVRLHHRRPEVSAEAASQGWGKAYDSLSEAAAGADIGLVGVPVSVVAEVVSELLAANPRLVVTDLGSTKASICERLAAESRAGQFVGSHPMCGSHQQGLAHADPLLYTGATVAVTPTGDTPPATVAAAIALWQAMGARCIQLEPAIHDRAVASASHLPHVLAAATAALLCDEGLDLAATGFRDTSRVAAGSPRLWCDILRENSSAVRDLLATSRAHLAALEQALATDDATAIEAWLEQGRAGRERFDQRDH